MPKEGLPIFKKFRVNMRTYTMFIMLLFIWVLFGSLTHWIFFTPRNMSNLFRQMTIISFLAAGMVLVIVTGNIDLSAGSVCGFISAIAAYLQANILPQLLAGSFPAMTSEMNGILTTIITIVVSIAVGVLVGMFQGSIIAYLGVPAFIVTLGGQLIFRGGVLGITQGKTIVPIEDSFRLIAQGYLSVELGILIGLIVIALIFFNTFRSRAKKKQYGIEVKPLKSDLLRACIFSFLVAFYIFIMNLYKGLQTPVLILAVAAVIMSYVTNNTRFGRYAYAIGGNAEATRLSGINIKKNVFLIFVLIGAMAAIAGIVLTGYVAAGTIGAGQNYELDAIASCILGGCSPLGGSGTIIGAMVGSLIMASLSNGMSVMNMDIFWQYIVKGLVLIFAVYVDVASNKSSR
jgi:D-xylose transport system permease protein